MATPERETGYTNDTNRTVYARESNGTGWFVGIIVVLALLAIGYLVFSANSGPSVDTSSGTPAIQSPSTESTMAPAPSTTAPITAPAPITEAPATIPPAPSAAPTITAPETTPVAPAAPATDSTTPAPATP